ncbi:MAG: hypothetical protein ACYSOT_03255, partial [Planctomycetota bacterium]
MMFTWPKAASDKFKMDAPVQESLPKDKRNMHRVMLVMVGLLLFFIVVCLSLTLYLVVRQGPAKPRPMVLRHPSDSIVPAGATEQDLERMMELSKDWATSHIKDTLNSAAKGEPTRMRDESLEKLNSIEDMLSDGRVIRIANGTHCLMTRSGWKRCRVSITEGPYNGQSYWVYRSCLSRPGNREASGDVFCGFMCASVYVQYFLSAAICCAGVYALKLKSMFMQIVLFIAGMLLLNLLW